MGGSTGGSTSAGGQIGSTGGAGSGGTGGASGTGGAGSGGTLGVDTVTLTNSTYTFEHFPIEVGTTGVWTGAEMPGTTPTSTTFDTVILENGFLKVTLLPEYGGRILSIVHKPTDRELLYQNPIGTPYLMYEDIFYYDYLVILGGIFPSFPEPEHGKYWNQPYALEVVSESADAVTVRMSRDDDLDVAPGVPSRYDVGRTGLHVELDVTLRAGRSSVELDTTLSNPGASAIANFEYWTVTTLAPGSMPGQTAIPESTRILAQMDQVHLLESSWPWFGEAETRIDGEVFEWNNLSHFENWDDQGTAFANPQYDANWSGLFNGDSEMGVLRVTEGGQTPGLKLWTFGIQSLSADLDDSSEWLRPTIEMWHGVTPEFWDRDTMAAGEVRTWHDAYFPISGLEEVTAASEYGAVQLSRSDSGSDALLEARATLTTPSRTVHAVLTLDGMVVAEEDMVVDSSGGATLRAPVPVSSVLPGAVLSVDFLLDDVSRLSAQTTLE